MKCTWLNQRCRDCSSQRVVSDAVISVWWQLTVVVPWR